MILEQHLRLCMTLHQRIAPRPEHPACWSPFSVTTALGMLAQCARAGTRDELDVVLLGNRALTRADSDKTLGHYAAELTAAAAIHEQPIQPGRRRQPGSPPPGARFEMANTLWVDDAITLDRAADEQAWAMWPQAAVRRAPLAHSPEHARSMINRSVADTTDGLIRELIPIGALSQDSAAAIVTALLLRSTWQTPFPARRTTLGPFHAAAGPVDVEMMRVTGPMRYGNRLGWQVVDIPASAGVVATVLLPDDPLAEAERFLDGAHLHALLQALRPGRVDLTLPRLRQRTQLSLAEPLRDSGIHTLFDQRAALAGLTQGTLAVSAVLHETILRLDEHGLEAAAATAVAATRSAPSPADVSVRADRPFLLAIRHATTGMVYFLARVTHP